MASMNPHRQQLSEFLKSSRARLSPSEKGLPEGRRRTPGLRREDVAALAGVSVTWYTWLEQGRNIKVSADVLDRICATLEMSNDERQYLFALVQHRSPPHSMLAGQAMSPALERILSTLNLPAFVKTARWDVIAWNPLVAKLFRDYGKLPPDRRNLLRILIVDDRSFRSDLDSYHAMVKRTLSKFRVDYSQHADDPSFAALIDELSAASEVFREFWNAPDVMNRSEAIAFHPQRGGMWFEHSSYVPEGSPNLRLMIFVPHDAETAAKVESAAKEIDRERQRKSKPRLKRAP